MSPTATQTKRWFDCMFQMRFSVFMFAVAGCALICWAYQFYHANIDPERWVFNSRIADLKNSDPAVRARAAGDLGWMPPARFADGAKALLRATEDPNAIVRSNAVRSLASSLDRYKIETKGEIAPERDSILLAFVASLHDPEPEVRLVATYALMDYFSMRGWSDPTYASMQYQAALAQPDQTQLNQSVAPKVVENLKQTLLDPQYNMELGTLPLVFSPTLNIPPAIITSFLQRQRVELRAAGVEYLAAFLRTSSESAEKIIPFLEDPDPSIRQRVVREFSNNRFLQLSRNRENVAHAMLRRLARVNPEEQDELLLALASYSVIPDELVPRLIKVLDEAVREASRHEQMQNPRRPHFFRPTSPNGKLAVAITYASPEAARTALPSLSRAAMNKNSAMREAAEAIIKIAPESSEAKDLVPLLASGIRGDIDNASKLWHAEQLAALGRTASDAEFALRQTAKHYDPTVRRIATIALVKVCPDPAIAVPNLANVAESLLRDKTLPLDALDELLSIDPNAPVAVNLLFRFMEIAESPVDENAIAAKGYLNSLEQHPVARNATLAAAARSSDPKRSALAKRLLELISEHTEQSEN